MLSKGIAFRLLKVALTSLLLAPILLNLTGCAHLIAHQISSQYSPSIDENVSEIFKVSRLCTHNKHCITVQNSPEHPFTNLHITLQTDDKHKRWHFRSNDTPLQKNSNHLIIVFPGFNTPKQTVAIHQAWLNSVTGADVIVIESANASSHFSFGLNAVEPVLSEVQKRKPKKVDVIGVSMGSVAAQRVASSLETSRLHLIAPMTDFHHSTLALWKMIHKDKFYSAFIEEEDIENAVEIVYSNARLEVKDINIIDAVEANTTPTYVYTSAADKVTLASDWKSVSNSAFTHHTFDNLTHIEMSSLMDERLLKSFLSNLIESDVAYAKSTTGLICDLNLSDCIDS
jgi:hypothetical protein